MPMTRSTISFTREDMELLKKAAKRQAASVSQFVRESRADARQDGLRREPIPDARPRAATPEDRGAGLCARREGAEGRRRRSRTEAVTPSSETPSRTGGDRLGDASRSLPS